MLEYTPRKPGRMLIPMKSASGVAYRPPLPVAKLDLRLDRAQGRRRRWVSMPIRLVRVPIPSPRDGPPPPYYRGSVSLAENAKQPGVMPGESGPGEIPRRGTLPPLPVDSGWPASIRAGSHAGAQPMSHRAHAGIARGKPLSNCGRPT